MRKERVMTLCKSFVDSNGDERFFVLAAVSIPFEDDGPIVIDHLNEFISAKGVKLGYSICNPADKFNADLGITIAVGRARKNSEYALIASKPGYINTQLVDALLEQEAKYFMDNPEYLIKGYKRNHE